jgi:isopenicillin-N epimerase
MRPEGFLLDPDLVYLNHGSYGACRVEVFEEYRAWQALLERDPQDFFTRRVDSALRAAREGLARFLGADADDLVFVPNATSGLNAALRSLELGPEGEVLTTAHEYGAILRTLEFVGASVVVAEPDELVSWLGPRTKVVLVSHVTSPTALVLPVEEVCAAAREAGALAIVDGAHAPGQLPLDLGSLGADVYAGNCHKWLGAPKGAGFLWARPEHHGWIAPLVISWGFREDADFGERHGWQGTRDPAAYLSVPRAIEAHAAFDLAGMRELADEAEARLAAIGCARVPGTAAPFMRAVELPPGDPDELARRLYEGHRIEIPVYEWGERRILRVSVGPYNDQEDVGRLVAALEGLL